MHSSRYMLMLTFMSVLFFSTSNAQNLIRNCGLDERLGCPSAQGQINRCKYWGSPGDGSTDYLNACNTGNFGVPSNQWGFQDSRSGSAYANIISYYSTNGTYREYLQGEMACVLQAGITYTVSFYVSCADDSRFAIDGMGAHFSEFPLVQTGTGIIDIQGDAHIKNPIGHVIDDKDNWVEVHGTYTAVGGEKYITIGNFLTNSELTKTTFTTWDGSYSAYFVEDVSVESPTPILDLGPDTTICTGESITFDISGICDNANLVWEDGSSGTTRTISMPGTYSIEGLIGCTDFYDQITISNPPDPGRFLPPDTVICPNDFLEIIPIGTYTAYQWQDGSDGPSYTTDTEGDFWLEVNDNFGCKHNDSITVYGLTIPLFDLGNDTIFCLGQEITLDPGIDSAFHHFLWSDYSQGTTLTVSDSNEYYLYVSNPCGEMTDSIMIGTYNCAPAVEAPNAFTPNGDGLNDVFLLQVENISNFEMYIFDRWGTLIYQGKGLNAAWDGKYKDSPAPTGTYVWLAIYDIGLEDTNRETKKLNGTLVLLR